MIRAVTFDFWGTLYDSASSDRGERPRRRAELTLSLLEPYLPPGRALLPEEAPLERVEEVLYAASRLRPEGRRAFTVAERLGWAARELGASVPEEALAGLADKVSEIGRDTPPRAAPAARAVVEDLARDFALGLVSDTGLTAGRHLEEIMRADGLAPPIRALSFSDETGVVKPHPDAFLVALDVLGVGPEEAAHVGDLVGTDVAGACALGMRAVWIGGAGGARWPARCAVVSVRRLAEVPGAIRSGRAPAPERFR